MMKRYIIICLFVLGAIMAQAQNSAAIKKLERQRRAALEEIESTNALLKETTKTAQNFLKRLSLLSDQITSRKKVISLLTQEVQVMDKELAKMNKSLNNLEKELKDKQQNYAKSARGMYKRRSSQDRLLYILSAEDFAQSIRRIRYLREYADWQVKQGAEIISKRTEIERKQAEMKAVKVEKDRLLNSREAENKNLMVQEEAQKIEVNSISQKKKELQAILAKKQKQARDLDKKIENQIAEEIARAEEKARQEQAREEKRLAALAEQKRKQNSKASNAKEKETPSTAVAKERTEQRIAEVKGGYAMTQTERKLSGDFANNQGKLPFPVSGKYTIIARFGEQQHQELKYVRTNNSGIDLQVSAGSDACAVFNGEVTRVFIVPGYNNSVIIRHGNYLTVYSNISTLYVKAGDKVTTRQAIGRIYSDTEDNNTTILHFQVWKERTKLNPLHWIR